MLGAILIHNEAFNFAVEIVGPSDFFRDAHRRIFEKMIALGERSDAIDLVTLKEALAQSGELDEVGGPAYIASLVDGVPRSTNVEYYARIVKEKSTLRALIHASTQIAQRAWEAEDDPNVILDDAERTIFSIAEDRARVGFVSMRQIVDESLPKIEQLFEHKQLITGVPDRFDDLDTMTRGLQPSDLVIVAARPSMGKTSLVLNMAEHAALEHGQTVGFFSLEMSKESLFIRLLTSVAQIDAHKLQTGHVGQRDYDRLSSAISQLERSADLHRRLAGRRRPRDARQGAASRRRARPEHAGRRLPAADDRPRPVRQPDAGAGGDLARPEGPGQGAERAGDRAVAVEPRARGAVGSPAAALGPARVGRPRAGRRRRHDDLPARDVPGLQGRGQGHRRAHHRQAAQRPHRHVNLAFLREHTRFQNLSRRPE